MRAVRIQVSSDLLRELLTLPQRYELENVKYDGFHRLYEFVVTGYDLPEVKEGEVIKLANVICHHIETEIKVGD